MDSSNKSKFINDNKSAAKKETLSPPPAKIQLYSTYKNTEILKF